MAILNANYVAARLRDAYPVLYTGDGGLVAHECILDVRDITRTTGVTVDDVAKRLIDYGFHAPTMSFPVAGTLMVEPTESESLAELDRFCDAMLAIRDEIAAIERGEVAHADSALAHAPHTAEDLLVADWDRAVLARATRPIPARVAEREVLAAGQPHRRRLRRPQPGVQLPADRGLLRLSRSRCQPFTTSAIWRSIIARARHQQGGDAALAPGLEVVADLGLGSDQVDVLDHRGRHRSGRVGLAAVEVGLLDLLAGVAVAEAGEHVLVEVAVLGTHPADVEREGGSEEVGTALDVVADDGRAPRTATSKSSAVRRAPGRANPSASASR